jgi:hypothetical protein
MKLRAPPREKHRTLVGFDDNSGDVSRRTSAARRFARSPVGAT